MVPGEYLFDKPDLELNAGRPVVALSVAVVLQGPAGRTNAAPAPAAEAGWTTLFNGKDFTGWKLSKPESFTIEDGAIAANGRSSHAYYDGSFLGHTFRNFELKVDVKVKANANGGSNGGVYILTDTLAGRKVRTRQEYSVRNAARYGIDLNNLQR